VVGGLSISMIVVSGLRFITSGGDSNKVSSAKSALIYALVGIAVAALAQALVHLVLYQSNKAL
jgi:ABC-type Fe3+-siderophore transport system permease subunit